MSCLLISDSTGSLGKHVFEAIATQFPAGSFALQVTPFVNSEARLSRCLERIREFSGIVIHATIYESFKRRIEQVCRRRGIAVYDLTGPIVRFLITSSGYKPTISYQKLHELSPDYFKRVDAIEFTISHDDGAGLATLHEADVILTGISRTTKTPTSMILATLGYRSANVPIVPGVEPARELIRINANKVVCLTSNPSQLILFRSVRAKQQLGFAGDYTDEQAIRHELTMARRISEARGWRLLDVTGKAVEETAARIIELVSV